MNRHVLVSLCASCCFFACSSADSVVDRPAASSVNQFRDALLADGGLDDGGGSPCAAPVSIERELMIRDPIVIEDPIRSRWVGGPAPSDGAWAFGKLMNSMAGPNNPSVFVRNWLAQWETPQSINGFSVQPRSQMKSLVTDPWLAASGGVNLDLTRAPFRLLAIVNRMDLGDLPNGSAGEGRFVFGVLDPAGNPLQFTVILEYRLPATTQADVNRWVSDWHGLAALPLGSPEFNQALEAITNRFAGPNAAPGRVSGSSIGQVRTNEIALATPWELREFTLDALGQLRESTVAQTADLSLNNTPGLGNFINANQPALLAGTHVVPLAFNGAPMRAGSALTPPGLFWNAPGVINNDARFMFSVNTCNGCHAGETGTSFLHVAPRVLGQASQLSGFLTGRTQPDPVSSAPRSFNDLARRATAFGQQICANVPPKAPDFTITEVKGPPVLSPGTAFVAQVTVCNQGNVPGSTNVDAVLSADAIINPAFPLSPIGDRVFPGPFVFLDVGQCLAVNVNATASPPGPNGTYFLGAVADLPNSTIELNETNNRRTGGQLIIGFGADLLITEVKGPTSALPGSTFTTTVTVCNQGNQSASAPVDVVLSPDTNISPSGGDARVGGGSVFLASGQCQTLAFPSAAAPNGPNGSYFLGAIVDASNLQVELNENNNTNAGAQMGIGFLADFVITDVKGPGSALPGAQFSAQVTVCNQGTTAGNTNVDLVLSADTVINVSGPQLPGGDRLVGGTNVPLNPGQCVVQTVLGVANSPGGNGLWFLGAIADLPNQKPEFSETNNTNSGRQLGIGFGPDFVITDVKGPGSALPGSSFIAQVTVCNQGTTSGSANVDLVLSSDAVISPSSNAPPGADRLVGGSNVFLGAGQCVVQNVTGFASPPGLNGVYFLGAIADFPNTSVELNETNNTNSGRQVGIGSGPDLVITSVQGPASAPAGSSFVAMVTACNQGNVGGGASIDLVLSADSTIAVSSGPSSPGADRLSGGTSVFLAAGQCSTFSINGFASPPGAPGSYFLGALADFNNSLLELNETNNASAGTPIVLQ